MEKTDIKGLEFDEVRAFLEERNEKPFRAGQLCQWMHQKLADGFDEMTNLPAALREKLKEHCTYTCLETVEVLTSRIDGTQKYLFRLHDGQVIESVLMKYHHGNSVCISTQAGCRMGCRFCASTIGGLVRNLETSELLDQIYRIQKLSGERVSNIVLMGTGEPLDNFENVKRFIRMISDERGLHISRRNITLSTCGLVPRIRELADEDMQITLALSLHASSQEKREALMPIAKKYALGDVLDACRYYFEKTGRRLTFEYSLVGGVNDSAEDAGRLAALLSGLPCHINLIPVNPVRERSFSQPDRRTILNFKNKLEKYGINVTIRREMGRDINGACGQLRRNYLEQKEE